MEPIRNKIRTWLSGQRHKMPQVTVADVRSDEGLLVKDFRDLVVKVANLSFFNPSFEMLFRGQPKEHKNNARQTSLLPSLFRAPGHFTQAMARLKKAEAEFQHLSFRGGTQVKGCQLLQWAILQHYEICHTPLLDVTRSLRVACSFSKHEHDSDNTVLYVLAVPQLGAAVAESPAQGIQVLGLLSVCPPRARRPHFQEGYLLGEYPKMSADGQVNYISDERDFGRRTICKFILPASDKFWSCGYEPFRRETLFPPGDPFYKQAAQLKKAIACLT